MKVFYISQCGFPSSAAQSVYDMCVCETFADQGYDTTLIIKNNFWERPPENFSGDVWDFYGVKRNFKIKRIFGLPRFTSWFQHKALKHVSSKDSFVFTQNVTTAVAAVRANRSVVLDRHGLLSPKEEQLLKEHVLSPYLLGVCAVTQTIRQDYIRRIPQIADKIIALPNGVRNQAYAKAAIEAELSERKKVIAGYLGSFHRGKGIEVILKIAELCPDISFHIYGGSLNSDPAQQICSQYAVKKLPENLKAMGFVPQSQVPKCIAAFDIALLPNQEKVLMPAGDDIGQWTSPMKMFEYMASGRAIIASDLPVLREVLEDGINAILVPPDDYDAWRDAIELLCSDPKLRKKLGKQAQKEAQEKYSWQARVERIIQGLNIESALLKMN